MGEIQKQSLYTTVISFVGLALGYFNKAILFPLYLLPDQIGLISLILSTAGLFAQLANLGTANTIVRFFPYLNESRKRGFLLYNLYIVLFGLLFFILMIVLLKDQIYEYYSEESPAFNEHAYWIFIIGAANLFFIFCESLLKAILQVFLPVMIQEFYLRILVTATILLYAFEWVSFEQFLIVHLLIHVVPVMILLVKVFRTKQIVGKRTNFLVPGKLKGLMLRYSILTYLNSIGITLVFSIDTLMLASIKGLKETGIYSTVLFISSALMIPYRSIFRISSAFIPKYWKNRNMEEMDSLYKNVSSINVVFYVYLCLVVCWNIVELFTFLPKEFAPGIPVFFVLIIGRGFDAYSGLNGYILITSKKYYIDMYFALALIVSAIVLNYFMIPKYGSVGAAWVTTIVIAAYSSLRVWYVWKQYRLHMFRFSNFMVVLIASALSLPLFFIPFDSFPAIVAILLKSVYLTLGFFGLVYFLKLDDQVNGLILKGIKLVTKK